VTKDTAPSFSFLEEKKKQPSEGTPQGMVDKLSAFLWWAEVSFP